MKENACGRDILFLFLDGILYFSMILFLESSTAESIKRFACQRIFWLRKISDYQHVDSQFVKDSDVLQEAERIKNNLEQASHNDALVVHHLTKQFNDIRAVDHLTFGIHEKECFGLLGVNGAGKTTTFRMLTGDCHPTKGNAYISNNSVVTDLRKVTCYFFFACYNINTFIVNLYMCLLFAVSILYWILPAI